MGSRRVGVGEGLAEEGEEELRGAGGGEGEGEGVAGMMAAAWSARRRMTVRTHAAMAA